ncbi:Ada metal-binding domain-containing protein [Mucilaginibacter panaciglaebae]|uniref:Ada DNA repair metal-binding domain-containing protein n=1 Tax=Mucilaginibacter panaciglaebae TaxID=502331 RepID=A0ABP7WTV2_9SPHI
MINHLDLGLTTFSRFRALQLLLVTGQITLVGNRKLKIYGKIYCGAGKRMKPANRVFFTDEQEALTAGYRPCGHCMPHEYKLWKQQYGN